MNSRAQVGTTNAALSVQAEPSLWATSGYTLVQDSQQERALTVAELQVQRIHEFSRADRPGPAAFRQVLFHSVTLNGEKFRDLVRSTDLLAESRPGLSQGRTVPRAWQRNGRQVPATERRAAIRKHNIANGAVRPRGPRTQMANFTENKQTAEFNGPPRLGLKKKQTNIHLLK